MSVFLRIYSIFLFSSAKARSSRSILFCFSLAVRYSFSRFSLSILSYFSFLILYFSSMILCLSLCYALSSSYFFMRISRYLLHSASRASRLAISSLLCSGLYCLYSSKLPFSSHVCSSSFTSWIAGFVPSPIFAVFLHKLHPSGYMLFLGSLLAGGCGTPRGQLTPPQS